MSGRFGSDAYGADEMVAELGAAFWSARFELEQTTRHDHAASGVVTLRYNGRLHHIGIGQTHTRTPVLLLIDDRDIRIINATTGELLRTLTLDPRRDCQPISTPKPRNPDPEGPGVRDVSRHHMVAGAGFEPATFGL